MFSGQNVIKNFTSVIYKCKMFNRQALGEASKACQAEVEFNNINIRGQCYNTFISVIYEFSY